MSRPTPEQIASLKAANPDTLLLFRTETGYAAYDADAPVFAGLTGTPVISGSDNRPIAWFPAIKLEYYLRCVVEAGRRAAVCEQVTESRLAKKPIERVVTPGTFQVTNDDGEAD